MSEASSHDALLHAFTAIADAGTEPTSTCLASLNEALRETADAMRAARQPIGRVVALVKALASDAGVRETHDRVVTNAVLWAIDYYYRADIELLLSVGAEQTRASVSMGVRSISTTEIPRSSA